jgi:transcriptional regulator with XRE-family HTH domain
MRPFRALDYGLPVELLQGTPDGLFCFREELSSVFNIDLKRYNKCYYSTRTFYFQYMTRKKHGPRKGIKHTTVKRSAFGSRLFTTRKAKGLSQKELGDLVGLSKRMISYYEGDTPGPPVAILKKLADTLNVTTSYLMQESPLKASNGEEISPTLRKHIAALKKLPTKEQKKVLEYADFLAGKHSGNR